MWRGGGGWRRWGRWGAVPESVRAVGRKLLGWTASQSMKEVADPKAVGAGEDPASAGAEAVSRATEVEVPFAAVEFVVDIMFDPERALGCTRNQG